MTGGLVFQVVAGGLLLIVSFEDARSYRVRNGYVLALAGLYVALAAVEGTGARFLWHLLFAAAALALLFCAFAAGLIGAGDAKLLTVGCLWVGPEGALPFALGLFVLSALYGLGAALSWLPAKRDCGRARIPLSPSVAGAWIGTMMAGAYV